MQPKAVYGLAAVALLGCVLSGTFAALYFSSQSSAKPASCGGSVAVGNSSGGAESEAALAAALGAASTNCKRCAALLSFAHAVGACNASSNECKLAGCNAGYASCDGLLDNGCEVALASDVDNCGACANKCTSYPNGAAACNGGVCTAVCNSTFKECDGLSATVCETNLLSNVSHCGSCGTACPSDPNGAVACNGGVCQINCNAGFVNCAGVCKSLSTDVTNCGSCGRVCARPNAGSKCEAGSCMISSCNAGFRNCKSSLDVSSRCLDARRELSSQVTWAVRCPHLLTFAHRAFLLAHSLPVPTRVVLATLSRP
jgi:hypothetical protein